MSTSHTFLTSRIVQYTQYTHTEYNGYLFAVCEQRFSCCDTTLKGPVNVQPFRFQESVWGGSKMKVTAINYPEFHERMTRLRDTELGLDGAICAKGGDVRVHLPYMAACNQTLFNRITGLAKQNKNELIARNIPLAGVQLIVDYCYSGEMYITNENFEHIIDAALGLEFLSVTEDCVHFALETNANANIWCHFLRAAFKHPRSVQPKEFVPNLILDNITQIPKEAITKGLDAAYIREILDCGKVVDCYKCYTVNLFLEIILADKGDIENVRDTIRRMRHIVDPGETLTLPKETNDRSVLALTKMALELNFTALVKACVENTKTLPFSPEGTSQVLKWMKQFANQESVTYLNQICISAFSKLHLDTSEDDVCLMLESSCLGELSEFDIFKTICKWIQHNNATVETKCRIISLIRFGLMTKMEMDEVVKEFSIKGCGEILVSAMQYHLKLHEQALTVGIMNRMRQVNAAVYIMGGEDLDCNHNEDIYMSESVIENGSVYLSPFTTGGETPSVLLSSACTVLNGFIFISGGNTELDNCVSNMWRFDPRTHTWLELEQMRQKRSRHTLTAMEINIVAVGGKSEETPLRSVEVYDVGRNMWLEKELLHEGIHQHAASYVDGMLYISGGSGERSLRCLSRDVWVAKAPMLNARQNHSMTSVSGTLFVAGGSSPGNGAWANVTSAECYDIVQDQWTELSSPQLTCSLGCSGRFGNWFYMFGGYNRKTQRTLDEIQRYNIESNTWEMCKIKLPLKMRRMTCACVVGE